MCSTSRSTAKVFGEVLTLVAQCTQINDLVDPGLHGRLRECAGPGSVSLGKVGVGQRMDEVVGNVLILEGGNQTFGTIDVSVDG